MQQRYYIIEKYCSIKLSYYIQLNLNTHICFMNLYYDKFEQSEYAEDIIFIRESSARLYLLSTKGYYIDNLPQWKT